METLNGWLNTFGVVPAEWYIQLNETQKLVFISQTGIALILAAICVYLLASLRRVQSVPNIEKEDLELDDKIGAAWHDDLVNLVNTTQMTRKQYKKYLRLIKLVCPGWLYVGTLGPKAQAQLKVNTIKARIQKHFQNGVLNPTVGWLLHLEKTKTLLEAAQRIREGKSASRSKFMSQ